ncbi:MAG: YqaJ viral recombinase family protein [archaeon]|nr:YqaJ viral recombinase family protein [archaeon]
MAFDGRINIIEIDDETKTVVFDLYRKKKISGTKLGPILGMSDLITPFKIACEIAGLYPGDKTNKYMEAGNIVEPKIRKYVRNNQALVAKVLGLPEGTPIIVEEPVEKEKCGYDHFHDNKLFGGLVDGYIAYGGKRMAILEIKTSHDKSKWLDADGNVSIIPPSYIMQAGLYAELSNLDSIVFAISFLEEDDYDRPAFWSPNAENTYLVRIDRPDMSKPMADAEKWYHEYIEMGETPAWTDKDEELVKYLKSYKPDKKKR